MRSTVQTSSKWTAALIVLLSLLWGRGAHADEYVIRGGDGISIKVMDHPEFSLGGRVRPDGMLSYPLVGDVFVRGFTPRQVSEIIAEKIKPYARDAVVTTYITGFFRTNLSIQGAVLAPGAYPLFEPISIIDALTLAGGAIDQEVKRVRVFKSTGEIRNISLESVWKSEGDIREREDLLLYPNDVLYVYENFKFKWHYLTNSMYLLATSLFLYDRFSG